MKKITFLILCIVFSSLTLADEDRRFHEGRPIEFHDRDVHRFHRHEMIEWRRGHWIQARRGGVDGWWWVIGPRWFYYASPVYPYPMIVSEQVVYMNATPPAVVPAPAPISPQGTTIVAPSSPQEFRYFCSSMRGYYPEVPQCPEPWRRVPSIPPGPIAPQ